MHSKTQATLVAEQPERALVQGIVNLSSAPALAKQFSEWLKSAAPSRQARRTERPPAILEVDLGGIERASTVAVALLLDWVDQARSRQLELRFLRWPEPLERIARFSNVSELLGIRPPAGDPGSATPAAGPRDG